jgi:type I restriction enzyme S subunit
MTQHWKTDRLGNVATLQRGFDLPHRLRKPGPHPIVTSSGIEQHHSVAKVPGPGVVTGRYGTIGKVFFVPQAFWPLNTTLYVRDFLGNDPLFVSYLLRTIDFDEHSGKTGVPGVNRNDLHEIQVSLPQTRDEQEAIAEALSDVDALIESLEQLLAKKRHLKQGAMQELLTGMRRLPGFSGAWETKNLDEVCWFQEGPGVRNTQFTSSGIKLLNGTNIFRGTLNLDSTSRFISESEAHGSYSHFLAEQGDIVIASSGITIDRFHEKVAIVREYDLPFCMNTSTIRFKPFVASLFPEFLFQFLTSDSFKRAIGGQATGSAQLNFGPSHVSKVSIVLPRLLEQSAIATVLSDMDAEIAALENKLTKARQLKTGMMQELLTGRIRLI